MLNILILCIGRQHFLADAFKEALNGRGKLFVADSNVKASGLNSGDQSLISPDFNSQRYIKWVLSICKKENIGLLFTLNVENLLVLEENRYLFEVINCKLLGGDIQCIQNTVDKYHLNTLCQNHGLPTIKTWLLSELNKESDFKFPLFTKPRFGKGSKGIHILINEEEYKEFYTNHLNDSLNESYIIQEFIEGVEFGFDVINDFNKKFVGIHVRRKLEMKNGETNIAITQSEEKWLPFGRKLSELILHQGTIDVDAIIVNNEPYVIDINYRFGGGYIFSHSAGANTPKAYVAWAVNEYCDPQWLTSVGGIKLKRQENGQISIIE